MADDAPDDDRWPLIAALLSRYEPPTNQAQGNAMAWPGDTYLYAHHLRNLLAGGVPNQGGISTIYGMTAQDESGRNRMLPTVWDNQMLPPDAAYRRAQAAGLYRFPGSFSPARVLYHYMQDPWMHPAMEQDVSKKFNSNGLESQRLEGPVGARNPADGVGSDYAVDRRTMDATGRDNDEKWRRIIGLGRQFPNFHIGQRESQYVEERRPGFPPLPPTPPPLPPQTTPTLWDNLRRNYHRAFGPTDEQMLPGPREETQK